MRTYALIVWLLPNMMTRVLRPLARPPPPARRAVSPPFSQERSTSIRKTDGRTDGRTDTPQSQIELLLFSYFRSHLADRSTSGDNEGTHRPTDRRCCNQMMPPNYPLVSSFQFPSNETEKTGPAGRLFSIWWSRLPSLTGGERVYFRRR